MLLRALRRWWEGYQPADARHSASSAALIARLGGSLWTADRADVRDGRLSFSGWVVSPATPSTNITFTVNGRPCDMVETGLPRTDLTAVFGFVPGAEEAGIRAECTLTDAELRGEVPIDFDAVRSGTLVPLRPWQALSCLPVASERWPLPDGPRIKRVHGSDDEAAFRLVGYSNFRKLARVVETLCGKPLHAYSRILDWGCGSGRLLRYLASLEGPAITGADIDADNLAWCRNHLPFATYVDLPLHPPSTLPATSFDLLVGLSIFTHLTEAVQFEWLAELERVSAPGATLLMSIHGPSVHAMTGSVSFCDTVTTQGIVDGRSHDLDDVLDDTGYYRTTHHAHEYVRREWGRYFEVVDILPVCIGNVQDLVVMRKRP